MIKYYQITKDILLEFIYEGDPKLKLNEDGIDGNKKNICKEDTSTMLLASNEFSTKYFCFKNEYEGLDSFSNLVLPLNSNNTQFVLAKSENQNFFSKTNPLNIFATRNNSGYKYEDTNYDKDIIGEDKSCEINFDKCVLHFTSRNYFGDYDGLIFQSYVYMKNKKKFYLSSFLFKKTSNLELKAEHMLYNGKLYTTQVEFDIPSVFSIFTDENYSYELFNGLLKSQNVELLENTPIGISVYGANSFFTTGVDNYVRLKTVLLNSISIPYIYNRLDDIYINISEAEDGDYYYIDTEMSNSNQFDSNQSFVNYINSLGENIRAYLIMHELYLKETWVDNDGLLHSEITHKEYHIIEINEQDEDSDIEKRLESKIKYRPICTKGGLNYIATIIDKIKIVNTVDNSSYEVTGSLDIENPYKYGKRLKRLDIKNDNRPIVNVYNKKESIKNTNNNIVGTNRIGGFVIENKTQNISSFIDRINIGVNIVDLSPNNII